MGAYREELYKRQKEVCLRLQNIMNRQPMTINHMRTGIGIAADTLKGFLANPDNRALGVKTILKIENWCDEKEKEIAARPDPIENLVKCYEPILKRLAKE